MLAVLLTTALSLPFDDPPLGTLKIDPVALIDTGKEVEGQAEHWIDREGYRYHFASAANMRKFIGTHKYDIQLGGGCGKMGSLSGKGSTERFAVSGGKLYLFASDGCRTGFLQNPEARIERDDLAPSGTRQQKQAGIRALDKTVAWMGGRRQLTRISTYDETVKGTYRQGDRTFAMENRKVYTYPDALAHFDLYDTSLISAVAKGKSGHFEMPGGQKEPFYTAQVREMVRIRDHMLVPAMVNGLKTGAVVVDRGDGSFDMFRGGVGVRIWADSNTGEVSAIESRSRGPRGDYGALRLTFTGFRSEKAVRVPTGWTATFNGEPAPSLSANDVHVSLTMGGGTQN